MARRWVADLLGLDGAVEAGVAGDLLQRRGEGDTHDARARGLDYTDAAPTSGTYFGAARGTLTAANRVDVVLA